MMVRTLVGSNSADNGLYNKAFYEPSKQFLQVCCLRFSRMSCLKLLQLVTLTTPSKVIISILCTVL